MIKDDIVKLAREQGLPETDVEGIFRVNSDDLGRLLAAEREACKRHYEMSDQHVRDVIEASVVAEREACAQLVETFDTSNPNLVAAAIRGRKE